MSSAAAAQGAVADPALTRPIAYDWSDEDQALLEEIERASFGYFWREVGRPASLVKDRRKAHAASVAGVGFQLASLAIGAERGWAPRDEAEARARRILEALLAGKGTRRAGVFAHFIDPDTGGTTQSGYERVASTIDHALLLAGAMSAAVYFGGEVERLVERLIRETDWRQYGAGRDGLLSMGWRPEPGATLDGPGRLHERLWHIASGEERLVYFLACGAPEELSTPPEAYYRLERSLHESADEPFVMSATGSLFTYWLAGMWIDEARFAADDPAAFGSTQPAIDWFQSNRRAILAHRQRCIELSGRYRTLSADRWGLTPSVGRDGYQTPELRPNRIDQDRLYEGTVAPCAAAGALPYTPRESLAALRAFRALRDAEGALVAWRDPRDGGYGLVDAFNLDQRFSADDDVAIDHGAILIAIENVRNGLIWRCFGQHALARRAVDRLGWRERSADP